MDKNIGKILDGRYEITELIGVGGMADVYKAMDRAENRTVAVKILKNEYADNDDFVRRFRNESKAIAVLSHPNIVKIYDVGFTDKLQFIVMEYIDGVTLKEFIEQQGVIKPKDCVHFAIQILRALQHAHDRGIVHRDIKPQNIMLFPDGSIKVMDFGIARFAREEGKTLSDKAIGSVHYISPEQARGDITDEKSDVYSVGVMMYEMLTGVKPFDGDTPIAVALMHMNSKAKAPHLINENIPEALETIVMRAMQSEAQSRYQSAAEMIKDIEQYKKNPNTVFEYDLDDDKETEKTQYFDTPVASNKKAAKGGVVPSHMSENTVKDSKAERKAQKKKLKEAEYEEYDDDDEEDEEEEVSRTSYFVVALTAIAAAVVILCVALIAYLLISNFLVETNTTDTMPNMVGQDYNYCSNLFADYFTLEVEKEMYSDDYEAGVIISHSPSEGSTFIVGKQTVTAVVSKGQRMVTVPNTYQIEASTAASMIEAEGLKVSYVKQNSDQTENTVISTEPARYESVAYGSTVIVYVSLGPEIYDVTVPSVVGMTLLDATNTFEALGFTVQAVEQDSLEDEGTVIEQSISAYNDDGTQNIVSPQQTVILYYSSGHEPTQSVKITFAVPDGLKGSATFNSYIDGNLVGTTSVDNIAYVSQISIPVEGTGTVRVVLEAVNSDGDVASIGEYDIDFTSSTVTEVKLDKDTFKKMFGYVEETVATAADETASESEELEDDEVENFWASIFGN